MSDETVNARLLAAAKWLADKSQVSLCVCEGCMASREAIADAERGGLLAWTSVPPTVPGDYLYAYRWGPDQPWVRGHIQLKGPPARTASEDRWFGPIPEIEPAKGGG